MAAKTTKNLKKYREMSVPHESYDAVDAAMTKFWDEVNEARERHKIADVTIIMCSPYMQSTDEEANALMSAHIGDSSKQLQLVAQVYGSAKADHDRMMESLTSKGKKS